MSVAIGRRVGRSKCAFLLGNGKFAKPRPCKSAAFLATASKTRWRFAKKAKLRPGRYLVMVSASDTAGNVERPRGKAVRTVKLRRR